MKGLLWSLLLVLLRVCSCSAEATFGDSPAASRRNLQALVAHQARLLRKRPYHGINQKSFGKLKRKRNREEKQRLSFHLKLRNREKLEQTLKDVYDPQSPRFQRFMTPDEFGREHGASEGDLAQIKSFLISHNLTMLKLDKDRLFVDVEGSVDAVNSAFHTTLAVFAHVETHAEYQAPIEEPVWDVNDLPVEEVFGLENLPINLPHYQIAEGTITSSLNAVDLDHGSSSNATEDEPFLRMRYVNFAKGLTPKLIRSAYGIDDVETGAGQCVAIIQFVRYKKEDMEAYAKQFNIHPMPIFEDIDVSSSISTNAAEQVEASLDAQMVMAMSPGVRKIVHYNGANNYQGMIETIRRMANDNECAQGSTSWGSPEVANSISSLNAQNDVYAQMAAQGQSFFAASGDFGAFGTGDKVTLAVDNPAAQPWVCAVGGTSLSVQPNGEYQSETTWRVNMVGSGGGISEVWPMPTWQAGVAEGGMRNVPDVSLNANPEAPAGGYWIINNGFWMQSGGTSAGSPLFSAFTALVNARRQKAGKSRLGNPNVALYPLMKANANNIHLLAMNDVSDNSDNGHYRATKGYDRSTGWGSIKGRHFLSSSLGDGTNGLVPAPITTSPTSPMFVPTGRPIPPATIPGERVTPMPTWEEHIEVDAPTRRPTRRPRRQQPTFRPTNFGETRKPTRRPTTKKPTTMSPTAMPTFIDEYTETPTLSGWGSAKPSTPSPTRNNNSAKRPTSQPSRWKPERRVTSFPTTPTRSPIPSNGGSGGNLPNRRAPTSQPSSFRKNK